MKFNREMQQRNEQILQQMKYKKNRHMLRKMHEKMRKEKYAAGGIDIVSSYIGMKNKNKGYDSHHAKVNLDILKHMHYSDFNLGDDDDFKPEQIIDEDDDSDDSILEVYKSKVENQIKVPDENATIAKNEKGKYDEKVIHIKHKIINNEGENTPREDKQALMKIREINRSQKPKGANMLSKYRNGRNASHVTSKNNLKRKFYSPYSPGGKEVRQNNSVTKISQSMDYNPTKHYHVASLTTPVNHHNSTNVHQNITIDAKSKNLLNRRLSNSKNPKNLPHIPQTTQHKHLRHNRNLGTYQNLKPQNTRTERGILKMVDSKINKGLKAITTSKNRYNDL